MSKTDPRFFGNNVYILGAGFSADAGMPVMSTFMTRMRDIRELSTDIPEEAAKSIDMVLQERALLSGVRDKIKLDLDNVEDLFSVIDASSTGDRENRSGRLATAVRKAISATLLFSESKHPTVSLHLQHGANERIVRELLNGRPDPRPNESALSVDADPYHLFGALLTHLLDADSDISNSTDTVITFNYDLVLEKCLSKYGVKPDYCLSQQQDPANKHAEKLLKIIKVHGSVNWLDKGQSGAEVVRTSEELVTDPRKRPLLVPPTWAKGMQSALNRRLWSNAVLALEKAHRVVIIGYSFPMTDLYFKYLLAAGFRNNSSLRRLSVINPKDMRAELSEILDDTYFNNRLKHPGSLSFSGLMAQSHSIVEYLGRGKALVEVMLSHD
jgi:hypothetical protein